MATGRAADRDRRRRGADAVLMLLRPLRLVFKIVGLLVLAIVVYFAVTLVQVWLTSRDYDPGRPRPSW